MKTRIKELREEKKLLQKDISTILNITQQQYSNIEKEMCELSYSGLVKLSNFYNVSIDYLLGEINIRNYDLFLKETIEIENNEKCKECDDYTLVSCNPLDYDFLCRKCGKLYNFKGKNITKTSKKDL